MLSSELFGSLNLPQNYMFYDGGCSAFGTLLFANLLPRLWNTGTQDCIGSGCYGWTHVILIVSNLVGMAATCAAGCRSRELGGSARRDMKCLPPVGLRFR